MCAAALSLLCLDILHLDPSSSHTVTSLYTHYLLILAIKTFGWLSWLTLQRASKDPEYYQQELLLKILQKNSNTEYGKKYDFSSMKNGVDFRKKHPLTDYNHYR